MLFRMKSWGAFAVACLFVGCTGAATPLVVGHPVAEAPHRSNEAAATPSGSTRLESAHRIDDVGTWERLISRPESQIVARTEVVKFLVDLEDERRLWFIDTQAWDIHYYFARDRLSTPEHPVVNHGRFNDVEYQIGSVV